MLWFPFQKWKEKCLNPSATFTLPSVLDMLIESLSKRMGDASKRKARKKEKKEVTLKISRLIEHSLCMDFFLSHCFTVMLSAICVFPFLLVALYFCFVLLSLWPNCAVNVFHLFSFVIFLSSLKFFSLSYRSLFIWDTEFSSICWPILRSDQKRKQ